MIYTEDQYNAVLQSTAAELQALTIAHTELTAAKDAQIHAITASLNELQSLKDTMTQRVSSVLQSGDPSHFAALAIDFLTPEQDKIRAEKLAKLETLKAELGMA